ncbi:YeiH family protein [Rathayibacter soli]|uniref:YeiH family protein n=1 Tax=Rathayibacter soli TaxID=3144168 RepID=UPI0027E44BB4|nr:putative sulfate exporter family transporter [Glaciibacter superstes]
MPAELPPTGPIVTHDSLAVPVPDAALADAALADAALADAALADAALPDAALPTAALPAAASTRHGTLVALLPGLGLAAAAVAIAMVVAAFVPTLSALLTAIVLGVIVRNTVRLPVRVESGLTFAAKKLLRVGIVLLGLQLVLGDIFGLGAGMIVVVVAIVTIGIFSTLVIGKWMGIGASQRLLIACGFSICGASAIAAADGVIETKKEEEVVVAVALATIFGTLMIPLLPLSAHVLGLSTHDAGLWAGGAIHEVAGAVAAGGVIGGAALGLAVIVKLARVLMLAPVLAGISIARRRALKGEAHTIKRPPIIPLFVAGFVLMVLIASTGIVPTPVLGVAKIVQTALLAAAMFALGTGVRFSTFMSVGFKPFALAAVSTVIVACTALGGVLLLA